MIQLDEAKELMDNVADASDSFVLSNGDSGAQKHGAFGMLLDSQVPGRRMGSYRILHTIGQGGYSKVKLAQDVVSGKYYALKVVSHRSVGENRGMKQIQTEMETLKAISHPNIINVVDVQWDARYPKKNGSSEQTVCMVLELALGGELFDFVSYAGAFSEDMARTLFHQIVAAVEVCHTAGIAHRDIKPENILFDENFNIKLADFGFAGRLDGKSGCGVMSTFCGTKAYMAPEMLAARPYDGCKVDIWALGVVAFILVAGIPPFQSAASSDYWYSKLRVGDHETFWQLHSKTREFSEEFKSFINKIFCPRAEDRMDLATLKQHPWMSGALVDKEKLAREMLVKKSVTTAEKEKMRVEEKRRKVLAACRRRMNSLSFNKR
eukprot:GILJ01001779.1.p1 GENE.GILJ01001779.1~~GILJ01001779.1.p1  ORF type:complete len:379 (-),score=52.96 GILJ01001779.1:385-1521(-)